MRTDSKGNVKVIKVGEVLAWAKSYAVFEPVQRLFGIGKTWWEWLGFYNLRVAVC